MQENWETDESQRKQKPSIQRQMYVKEVIFELNQACNNPLLHFSFAQHSKTQMHTVAVKYVLFSLFCILSLQITFTFAVL